MLPVRVLLVDDDTLVRRAVRQILEAADDLEVVGEASDGDGAVRQAPQADVVLMDLRMPGMSGVEATSRITHSPSSPKVVVLTTVTADAAITDAVHAGASGFLLKASSPDDIVNAVRAVHAGDAFMSPTRPANFWNSCGATLVDGSAGLPARPFPPSLTGSERLQ